MKRKVIKIFLYVTWNIKIFWILFKVTLVHITCNSLQVQMQVILYCNFFVAISAMCRLGNMRKFMAVGEKMLKRPVRIKWSFEFFPLYNILLYRNWMKKLLQMVLNVTLKRKAVFFQLWIHLLIFSPFWL